MTGAGPLMDRIYARQRHVYDATRKFYLLGRDRIIADLDPPKGGRVLEIGCGTARNLIAVARRHPTVECYGIDISREMLRTAHVSVERAALSDRVHLAEADAATFDGAVLFDTPHFDRVVISYALSMIPMWQNVLRQASGVVAPGGSLHIVDFGDQAGLPKVFKRLLLAWLAWFHVTPRAELPREIERLARQDGMTVSLRSRFRGYAMSAALQRTASASR